jgi:NitT/TauT family transport system ATP-binding protein
MMKLSVKKLSKSFPVGDARVVALDGVDLDVGEGEFICLLGPSGCGKSTLLFIASGLEHATSGTVFANGRTVTEPDRDRGMLFQQFALYPWRTARQNVEFGLEISGMDRAARREKALYWLDKMNLTEFADTYPHRLSGGMQQRIAIARLLANEPDILLMDEPFAALDAQTRGVLGEELVRVWQDNKRTVLFVTHSVDEAILLADRVVVMTRRPGRIKADMRIDLARPRDTTSHEFNRLRQEITGLVRAEVDE